MSEQPPGGSNLEQRLTALEAQNQRLRLAVGAIALGLVVYAVWHTLFAGPIRATTVEAQRVIVRDPAGRIRLVLGTDEYLPPSFHSSENPGVLLYDEQGALRGQLYASDEQNGLDLFDPDGKRRATFG